MGGIFSGRTAYATTPSDRECLKLDVDEFTDVLDPDTSVSGTCRWGEGDDAPAISWSTIDDVRDEAIRLEYTVRDDGEHHEKQYPIWIERTECNFGGTRPWWTCPDPGCSERVGTLYLPPGEELFCCRHCHDFGYTSSRASGNTDRTLRMRYNRVRKKLDAEPCHPNSLEAWTPDRPKGMHQDTYDDLVRELRRARNEWEEKAFMSTLRKYSDKAPFEVD